MQTSSLHTQDRMHMVSELVQKSKSAPQCRGTQYHRSIHSPKYELEFCKKCDAYVEFRKVCQACSENPDIEPAKCHHGFTCYCCGSKTEKPLNKLWLQRVLNSGIRQHSNVIRDWCRMPTRDPVDLEIFFKGSVYGIQIKYLALFMERINEEDKMNIISKKIWRIGFNIFYPDIQEMQETCVTCGNNLVFNMNNKIFCKTCNGNFH